MDSIHIKFFLLHKLKTIPTYKIFLVYNFASIVLYINTFINCIIDVII